MVRWKISKSKKIDALESYEIITEDIRKSAASGIARGIVGDVLLEPVDISALTQVSAFTF